MKYASIFCVFVLAISTTGCGQSEADRLMQKQIKLMNDSADAMQDGSIEDMFELQSEMVENAKKMAALDLSEAEMKQLANKYEDEINKATSRIQKAQANFSDQQTLEGKKIRDQIERQLKQNN